MLWVYGYYKYVYPYICGDRLQTSESEVYRVYRRQILTSKVDPRAVRVELPLLGMKCVVPEQQT